LAERNKGKRALLRFADAARVCMPSKKACGAHFAALPWQDLPGVMERIAATRGMGALALRFAIVTAARSGEVRKAHWSAIDMAAKVWVIPADQMKAGLEHHVPLCDAALDVLDDAKAMATRGTCQGLLGKSGCGRESWA
jgi:integrase